MTHLKFLGDESDLGPDKHVTVLSAPLASSLSWGKGSDSGPAAILEASPALEVFDDELFCETVRMGIDTLPIPDYTGMTTDEACRMISASVGAELDRGRFPVLLGGEHTVTVPAVEACRKRYPDLHVVQIDAHLDLRDQYENNPQSHACVMRRLHDLGLNFTQVGMRSFSMEEWELVRSQGWQPFLMSRIRSEADWVEAVCREISGPVYLTFDVDGLDPSIMPATGTPEPGGLLWDECVSFLRRLVQDHTIVGCDFVEFSPRPGAEHAAFTIAKLIYRTLGFIYQKKKISSEQGDS